MNQKTILAAAITESRSLDRIVPVTLHAEDISALLPTIELVAGSDCDYAEESDGTYDVWSLDGQPMRLNVTVEPVQTITLYRSVEHWRMNGSVRTALGMESDTSENFGQLIEAAQNKVSDILESEGYRVEFTHKPQSVGVGSIVATRNLDHAYVVADAVVDAVAALNFPRYRVVSLDDWYVVPAEFVGPWQNEGIALDVLADLEDSLARETRDDYGSELPFLSIERV